jgi:transcriptional regulator
MYINKNNRHENQDEIYQFVRQNGFAIVASQVDGRPWATHIPLMLHVNEAGEAVLHGHVARPNPQWRNIAGQEVLAIFNGPHAYISSSWYDHENVPTWNYTAVHAYGPVRILEGDALIAHLSELVDYYEQFSDKPVSVRTMTPGFLKAEIRGLIAIEIAVTEFQSVRKLSQNRDDHNHTSIVQNLQKRGDDDSLAVATEMITERSHATH